MSHLVPLCKGGQNSKVNKTKIKLGSNHKKTQKKLNKLTKRIANQKIDLYHKITTQLTNKFDLIVVEDLKTKNMSKSSYPVNSSPNL